VYLISVIVMFRWNEAVLRSKEKAASADATR
jgi:hypothetical protein